MMKCKKFVAVAGFLTLSSAVFAQTSDPVLMKVGSEVVTLSEFEAIYKKNLQKDQKITQESLDEYLTLFTNFKLKVLAAKEAGVDTLKHFKLEYNGYKKQLGANYMRDSIAERRFAEQMADRVKKDLEVAHILIKIPNDCDTLNAYKKALDIQKKLAKGLKWSDAVKTYSEDEFSKEKDGNLGWFTGGMWAYSFETAAYSAKNGAIVGPVRTKSGYHIIKRLNERPARGDVKVAHIFVAAPIADATLVENGSKKINDAYSKLQSGAAWLDVVMEFSEDRNTMGQGGELPAFSIGQMVPAFEDAAFALKNVGDYSKPVQTNYGWHILRLVQKGNAPDFEADPDFYLKRIQKSSSLSQIVQSDFANKVKSEFKIVEFNKFWEDLQKKFGSSNFNPIKLDSLPNSTLFTIDNVEYTFEDFKKYYSGRVGRTGDLNFCQLKDKLYASFLSTKVLESYEDKLEDKYPAYKALMKEFKEGMMQFELMKNNVWDKSVEDTAGLRQFFNARRGDYMWGERYEAYLFTSGDSAALVNFLPQLNKIASKPELADKLLAKINKKEVVISKSVVLEEKTDKNGLIAKHVKSGKTSGIYNTKYNYNALVVVGERKPEQKELKEAKGIAVSRYQEYLEEQWLKELKAKYPVEVNQKVLYKLITR
ncbi:MAG TPA: peptidylprolyl isomerase [Bacteroidia bacterium]